MRSNLARGSAGIYLTEIATLNRYVLKLGLKFARYDDSLISSGNPFHNVRPATKKAQSPFDFMRDPGTYNARQTPEQHCIK